MKSIFTFLGTFVLGALLALAARPARHDPHAARERDAATPTRGDYAPMVTNSPPLSPPAPAAHSSHPAPTAADPHAGHPAATWDLAR